MELNPDWKGNLDAIEAMDDDAAVAAVDGEAGVAAGEPPKDVSEVISL